jgi:hypothetical protein
VPMHFPQSTWTNRHIPNSNCLGDGEELLSATLTSPPFVFLTGSDDPREKVNGDGGKPPGSSTAFWSLAKAAGSLPWRSRDCEEESSRMPQPERQNSRREFREACGRASPSLSFEHSQ